MSQPYCTAADVRAMLKEDAFSAIIDDKCHDDPEEREALLAPILQNAVTDAAAEIDGYLAKRYPLPLVTVPSVIYKFAKDIAVYNLYSREGIDENSNEKNILTRYKAAIKFLEMLADGRVDIGITDTQKVAQTSFTMSSNPRLFSRGSLRGM